MLGFSASRKASQFREKLEKAEVSLSEEAQRRRDLLESERLRSLGEGGVEAAHWKTAAEQAQQVSFGQHSGRNKELEPLGAC